MDPLGGCRNYQLLSVLAQRICSLVVCLIKHVRQENIAVQTVLRQALLPMHRALTEFLFGQAHSSQHSPLQLRGSTHSLLSLPSMPVSSFFLGVGTILIHFIFPHFSSIPTTRPFTSQPLNVSHRSAATSRHRKAPSLHRAAVHHLPGSAAHRSVSPQRRFARRRCVPSRNRLRSSISC